MRHKVSVLLLVCLFAWPAMAQRIITISGGTVTANVTDSQDFLVNLTTNVTSVTLTSTVTPATGYIVSMKFVQDATGNRTVAFGGNITTSCSVNATAGAVTICRWQYTASGNTWADAGGGGGVSPTPGSQVTFGSTVSPLAYGAKWDVKAVSDASMTNASNTVTCPNADCSFTSADLGKIVFGTTFLNNQNSSCSGATCGSVIVPQGFICTINNANSISVGTTFPGCAADNATASCAQAGSTLCGLLWGTQDDSTAIQNAAIAAWTGTACQALEFPSGMAFITIPSGGLLNVAVPAGGPCGSKVLDTTQAGAMVLGQGPGASTLIPLPSVNFANCTAGNSATACIAGPANWEAHDWGIQGWGQSGNGTTHANNLIEFYGVASTFTGTAAWNMAFGNWQESSISSKGFNLSFGGGVIYSSNIVSEGFGNTNCFVATSASNNTTTLSGLDCFGSSGGSNGASLQVSAAGGSIINSTGGQYWGINNAMSAATGVLLTGTGQFNSFSDTILGVGGTGNQYAIRMTSSGGMSLSGSRVAMSAPSGTTSPAIACTSGSTCNFSAYASTLSAVGAAAQLFNNQSSTFNFFDACANTYTQGSVASSAINVFGSCSVTGTPITAAKLVLSAGWGNTPAAAWTALTGATQSVQGTITNGTAGLAANPTITYTFPTPYLQAPAFCSAYQVGGTQAILAASEFLTPSSLTNTGVVFTFNTTPTASATEVIQILCSNQ